MRTLPGATVAAAALLVAAAVRADVASEPVLRIEAEQHTAVIRRLDVNRAGKVLVTGSDDKTARVWSLPEGRLLKVLRPPIGPGNEGKVFAVALSPDGATVAVGGWTTPSGLEGSIYLFDRESGQITRRLGGLENVVEDLAFSADGRRLAAGLGSGNGIRVWRTSDWSQELADREYKDSVYGVAFAPDGRLAATCWDGMVRLYDARLRRIAREKAPAGEQPYGVAFAPDGTRLAVGYVDTTAVSVLSATDLKPLFAPDTSDLVGGNLGSVTWSADGRLWAGGTHWDGQTRPLVGWADGGRGARSSVPMATNTIMDLQAFGAGIAVANYDPAFAIVAADGRRVLVRGPEQPDLRDQEGVFAVAKDGRRVRFGLDVWGKSPVRFDFAERRIEVDAPEDPALAVARTQAAGLEIHRLETGARAEARRHAASSPEVRGVPECCHRPRWPVVCARRRLVAAAV